MSKPTTPLDSELAGIFGNNTRIFRAMRELFKQAGDLSPAAIEEALIAAGTADNKAVQALDILNRIANSIELASLAPQKEDIKDDDLTPRQEFTIPDTLADLSPRLEADPTGLTQGDIGVTVQAFNADLDIYSDNPLTAEELGELQNINSVTISNPQWIFLGDFDQALTTTSNVAFGAITASGILSTSDTTQSTSPTTGSGQFAGGLGVELNFFIGGKVTIGAGGTTPITLGPTGSVTSNKDSNSTRTGFLIANPSGTVGTLGSNTANFRLNAPLGKMQLLTGTITAMEIAALTPDVTFFGDLTVNSGGEVFLNLPTIGTGTSGSLWNDTGTVKVVP